MQDKIKQVIYDYGVEHGWDANYVEMASKHLTWEIMAAISGTEEAKEWAREQLKPKEVA